MSLGEEISLDHLDLLTDSTGLMQHAIYSIPRRESGYTTDDNARALRLCARLWRYSPDEQMLGRITGYLSFLEYARRSDGRFNNFMSYQRNWLDSHGCSDCQGQAACALAEVITSNLPNGYRLLARELLETALPTLADIRSLRAQAYVIQAWDQLAQAGVKNFEQLEGIAWSAARCLEDCFHRSQRPEWKWFESRMTYANAVLPNALFVAARLWPKEGFLDVATTSFAFLDRTTTIDNIYWPIGNHGWYVHGEEKARYDQQPVEAATMAEAALAGFALLNEDQYLRTFHRSRDWFHGQNSLRQPIANVRRGACYDGLLSSGVNRNQGAESTLAYLWTEARHWEIQHTFSDDCLPTMACV